MACIPSTLERWVYIIPIHGPLDGPLYTWAQYTPTVVSTQTNVIFFLFAIRFNHPAGVHETSQLNSFVTFISES